MRRQLFRVEVLFGHDWHTLGNAYRLPKQDAIAWAAEARRHGDTVRVVSEITGEVMTAAGCPSCRAWAQTLVANAFSISPDMVCRDCGEREADVVKTVRAEVRA